MASEFGERPGAIVEFGQSLFKKSRERGRVLAGRRVDEMRGKEMS